MFADQDEKFDVTVISSKDGRHIPLRVPRTAEEVAALREKGHVVLVRPTAVELNEPPYRQALRALTELHSYAAGRHDTELAGKALHALQILLEGRQLEEAPSSVQRIRAWVGESNGKESKR